MKRIMLALSLLALLFVAAGLVFTADSTNLASSNRDAAKKSPDIYASRPIAEAKPVTEAKSHDQTILERDAGEADLPAALGRHLEKLMRTVPGNGGAGPAGSAAEWRFMARASPDTDISLDKIEGARAAHAAHLAKGF